MLTHHLLQHVSYSGNFQLHVYNSAQNTPLFSQFTVKLHENCLLVYTEASLLVIYFKTVMPICDHPIKK